MPLILKLKKYQNEKTILTIGLLICLFISTASFSSEKKNTVTTTSIGYQYDTWVEYVAIGGYWFKITHFDDGIDIIEATGIAVQD